MGRIGNINGIWRLEYEWDTETWTLYEIVKLCEGTIMNAFAVVRADSMPKVKIALCDLVRYAHLTFVDKARMIEPTFADNILVSVMKSPLRTCCEAASIVALEDDAAAAIGRVRKIHPPAHVIIVSPRHEIFEELADSIDILPIVDLDLGWDTKEYLEQDVKGQSFMSS